MKFTELKQTLTGPAAPVYLLEGEDAYFRQKGEEMIKAAYLAMPELNFAAFDGESLKGGELSALVSAVRNYPFMAEKRVIKVSEFYPTEADFERYLKPLFDDFPPTALLIIANTGAKRGSDLKRKKGVTFIDCGKAEPETVARWIYITLKRAGVACAADLCERIAEWCLCDMARVSVEVRKIIDFKGSGQLSEDEAEALVYKDADYRVYEMTNALARRNYTAYCEISSDLKKKGYDEISILNGLFSYFRSLLSAAASPLPDWEYAKENGLKEYSVKKNREQARVFGTERLSKLADTLYSAVAAVKSGTLTPQSALSMCENAIFFGGK